MSDILLLIFMSRGVFYRKMRMSIYPLMSNLLKYKCKEKNQCKNIDENLAIWMEI